jgi:TldD protein
MVGLLCHEAIGHTVEADFVLAGSVAADQLHKQVASELVTLADSGTSEFVEGAGGTLPVDDEGVITRRVDIIKDGKLVNYLHNRETAAHFDTEPGGNARAWEFSDEPLVRMRNTFIQPGQDEVEKMISEIKDGFYIDGPEGGQADATGEFMFGACKVRKIRDGKLAESMQRLTVAGQAFEVLKTVDAVSKDFRWELGSGHCGKGQPAKVDAGGPFVRCEVMVGGKQ